MLQQRDVEVDEKARARACQPKIADHLRAMGRVQGFDRLDFHDHEPFDEEIDSLMTQKPAPITNRKRLLALERDPASRELHLSSRCVHSFAHSRAEITVDSDQGADDTLYQRFEIGWKI